MKIHEYQGKQLFKEYGIAISSGELATTPAQAREIVAGIGTRCAIKAQVHIGGRGKAGGVKLAADAAEAEKLATDILGMDIKGHTVKKVWVEQAVDIAKEAYLAIMLDRTTKQIVFICSAEGGIDIEEVAATQPEKIHKIYTDSLTFPAEEAKAVAGKLFGESAADGVYDVMEKLFKVFCE